MQRRRALIHALGSPLSFVRSYPKNRRWHLFFTYWQLPLHTRTVGLALPLYYFPTYDFAPVYLPPHASTPIYAVYAPQAFPTRRSLSRDAHVHLTTLLRPLAADRFLPYPCAAHSVLALPLFSYSFL